MNEFRNSLCAGSLGFLLCVAGVAAAAAPPIGLPGAAGHAAPPTARTVDHVDYLFGLTLPDPYRWMEGARNPEFDAWLDAQGTYARSRLDALPTLAAWRERLRRANAGTVFNGGFRRAGGKLFFLRVTDQGNARLMARDADGTERLLVDPARAEGAAPGAAIQAFAPAPDGRMVAVSMGLGAGMEVSRIRVLDTETLQWLPDAVEPVFGEFTANWLPDGSGFTYTQMVPEGERAMADPMQGMRTRFHRLGTAAAGDPILLAADGHDRGTGFVIQADEFPVLSPVPGSRWALAGAGSARPEARLCVAPLDAALRPATQWRCIAEYRDGIHGLALHGDTLYLLSVQGAPNGRVLALDLAQPGATLADARVVVPTAEDVVITELAAARDALYVKRMRRGIDELLRVDHATGTPTPIAVPVAGSISFDASPGVDGIVLKLRGWTTPGAGYAWRDGALRPLGIRDASAGDYSVLTSVEAEATSADGTRVPISFIRRRDAALDGRQRALVEGYGGYGISIQPVFEPITLEWVKAGAVYAACHVRGGGELGDAWHRGGQGAMKHKGVEDFIACADELVRRGYTTPTRTALQGTSMGGILVGGAITAFPDRFGAALVDVGLLNPVRLLAGENGATQIGELGDPRTEAGLKAIAALDPYQRIRPGTHYPAVLFQVGMEDSRVSPWHAGKFAAGLQAASSGGKPIWIRTDDGAGHFAFSLGGKAAQATDQYAFLDAMLRE